VSLREWLLLHWDDLIATEFMAVVVAALVGFFKRSTGMAVFVSCTAATVLVLMLFPLLSSWGYDWRTLVTVLGPGAGLFAVVLFRIAIKIADRLEARDAEVADKLINKGVSLIPGSDK
jgi:hypothetical protein